MFEEKKGFNMLGRTISNIIMVAIAFFAILAFRTTSYAITETENVYVHLVEDSKGELGKSFRKKITDKFNNVVGRKFEVKFGTTRKELINVGDIEHVDWIIYIGHGSSCTGGIADGEGHGEDHLVYPSDLKGRWNWSAVKGVLIFGCAVVDIGDFGWQHTVSNITDDKGIPLPDDCNDLEDKKKGIKGNYCRKYYKYHAENSTPAQEICSRSEFPDPGLKWEDLAKENSIRAILGFNFYAPLMSSGGEDILMNFLDKWLNEPISNINDNLIHQPFYLAWKDDLTKPESDINKIERAYIRCDEYYENNQGLKCSYSMGRANNLGESKWEDDDIFWPSIWKKRWGNNWLASGNYQQTWPGGESDEMSIDDYKKCIFPDINLDNTDGFDDAFVEVRNEVDIHARELCLRGIIKGGDIDSSRQFKPTSLITRAEVAKMITLGAGLEDEEKEKNDVQFSDLSNGDPIPDLCKCGDSQSCEDYSLKDRLYSWAFGCIRELRNKGATHGFPPRKDKDEKFATFRPGNNITRKELAKFVMLSFFQDQDDYHLSDDGIPKETECSAGSLEKFIGLPDKAWFCSFITAAFNCDIYTDEDLSLAEYENISPTYENIFNGLSTTDFGADKQVTRGEVAIVLNRARRLKEAGVKKCFPKKQRN
ncbi:MAG: hypothetical protein D3916_07790 [Candidatus Electrothrix sp. MAN1_4]|nr:hypothetical protein [Candidatus Electrothrix sp. MAN1_4]